MKFKFISESERRALLIEAASGRRSISFCHLNGRRYVVQDEIVCLVEGIDQVVGESVGLAPLTVDESQRVIEIIQHHTQGRRDDLGGSEV